MLKPWSQPTEIPAGQRSYRSKAINIYSFKPLVGILLSKQMKTSTVGLNFLYVTGESPAFKKTCEKRLCLETVLKRKSQNLSCCRRKWKHLFIFSGKTGSMRGSLLLWSFQHFSLRARLRPPGPHPSPSLWTVRSADLSRWPPRPACVCSRAAPSPGKGTSTRGTPFLCNSGRPARWALIPPWSEQIPWHWGLLHSPAACTHAGIIQVPAVITDGAPGALVKDLHSPGAGTAPVHQAELSAVWGERNGTMGVLTGEWEGSSVLWDPHFSNRGRSPLRPQSLLVQIRSRCTAAAPGSDFLQKQQWSEVWKGWRTRNY